MSSQASDLLPIVYDELRALAGHYLGAERSDHTLQPTALVHEAYIRLAALDRIAWRGKNHFFAMAAIQMRRVLVEHARLGHRLKRPPRALRITLGDDVALSPAPSLDLLALDEALERLERKSVRQCRVAELRLFAGMTAEEIAGVLEVSDRTVKHDWQVAQVWLSRELGSAQKSPP